MLPAVASSSPATSRRQVVFPQPDGPTSTVNCRSGTSSVTLFTAMTLPNCLDTCSRRTLAMEHPSAAQSLRGRPHPMSCRRPSLRRRGGPPLLFWPSLAGGRRGRILGLGVALHRVESEVGHLQELVRLFPDAGPGGDAPGEGRAYPPPGPVRKGDHYGPEPIEHLHRLRPGRLGQQEDELVPPEPRGQGGLADGLAQRPGDPDEDLAPDRVAVEGVDGPE